MKPSTLLETMAFGALCAFSISETRFHANAEAATEPAAEILPLVQFEEAPLVDVIKTLARQAHLNIIIDPRVIAADESGKSLHRPISMRLENVTAQNVLEVVLRNNELRLERDPKTKVSRIAFKDSAPEGQDIESLPPVVVKTVPESGAKDVAPGIVEIKVTFSKEMTDQSWSWSSAWQGSTPEALGKPKYEADRKTCVIQVKLEPNKTYGYWLNNEQFRNFKDRQGHPAVPYLLVFETADRSGVGAGRDALLNEDQRHVFAVFYSFPAPKRPTASTPGKPKEYRMPVFFFGK